MITFVCCRGHEKAFKLYRVPRRFNPDKRSCFSCGAPFLSVHISPVAGNHLQSFPQATGVSFSSEVKTMGRKSKYVVPTARTKTFMKDTTGFLVGFEAAEAMSEAATAYVAKVTAAAADFAAHAGRKTIQDRDVVKAVEYVPVETAK